MRWALDQAFAVSGSHALVRVVVVAPPDRLDAELAKLVAAMTAKPRDVIAAGKALFYAQLEARLAEAYGLASRAITRNMLGPDAGEGVGAFLEKRKPRWDDATG